MKGFLYLINQDTELNDYSFTGDEYKDYSLTVKLNLNENYSTLIKGKKEKLQKALAESKKLFMMGNSFYDKELISIIDSYKDKEDKLFEDIEFVNFDFSMEETAKYIKENPDIKTKKIILSDTVDLSWECLKKIETIFKNDVDCLYFRLSGNTDVVSFNECKQTLKIINQICAEVKSLNLSPIEQIMYVYDLVRNREYIEENKDEDLTVSRDLTSVLLGNKIVCAGYAHIFKAILDNLGFKNEIVLLVNKEDNKRGHSRNVVHIKDNIYNIDGIYYFDTTWDSKKNNSNNFLLSYRFFAKTKEEIDELSQYKYEDYLFGNFDEEFISGFAEFVNQQGIKNLSFELRDKINNISNFISGKNLIPNLYLIDNFELPEGIRENFDLIKTIKKMKKYYKKFNKPLDAITLLKVLYNVRKKQYYINPSFYPFGIKEIYCILLNSQWEFNKDEKNIWQMIFGKSNKVLKTWQLNEYIKNTGLDKDIEEVKLARTLRTVLDKNK